MPNCIYIRRCLWYHKEGEIHTIETMAVNLFLFVELVLLGASFELSRVFCIPPPTHKEESLMKVLSKEEFTRITSNSVPYKVFTKRTSVESFKHKYVYCNGSVADDKSGTAIDIMATAAVSEIAHDKAATIISRMVMHMPSSICNTLASRGNIGVFTKSEGLTIYPANYDVQDRPECEGTCAGSCNNTCTFDGRKYSTLAGAGGSTATVIDDNLLCNSDDPYTNEENILVHEFAHSIHLFALDAEMEARIINAYNAARAQGTWELTSYEMANDQEYFAEGAAAFFNTKVYVRNGNYMNECSPGYACNSDIAARNHIYQKDRELYDILTWIFTSNRPELPGNLSPCV